jgi:hypothetical protein
MENLHKTKPLEQLFIWLNLILFVCFVLLELFGIYKVFIEPCPALNDAIENRGCGEGKGWLSFAIFALLPPVIIGFGLLYTAFKKSWSIRWWLQGLLIVLLLLVVILPF